jgi:hypothetical protein
MHIDEAGGRMPADEILEAIREQCPRKSRCSDAHGVDTVRRANR